MIERAVTYGLAFVYDDGALVPTPPEPPAGEHSDWRLVAAVAVQQYGEDHVLWYWERGRT